ncbi:DUF1839 family protein [Reinekea sp. G2M2-21]|uniref:DUF1839 family protein n=1 Tax=Reinekea sp. G2M2-21 TaxID=2788942 RepID=UPI0018AB2EE7|nr:DUF1839 family protein [Reinekea sp. G2M2-21]
MQQIRTLDVQTYQPHYIHGPNRIWTETNCYVDVVIELIHALGFDPVAALPFTLTVDFEGDQWTFFKYSHQDLFELYGLEIQELNPWENLEAHIEKQIGMGRPVLVELDSYYLPDTAGTTYGSEHVKSTVAVNAISVQEQRLGYFHGQSYYQLQGNDFRNIFQTNGIEHPRILPPYIELVKLHKKPSEITLQETVDKSLLALERQLKYLPNRNPFESFLCSFEKDLPKLKNAGIEHFHQYSFATLRQLGACFELASTYLQWLSINTPLDLQVAVESFLEISKQSKSMQFQLARAVSRDKPVSLATLEAMGNQWQIAQSELQRSLG